MGARKIGEEEYFFAKRTIKLRCKNKSTPEQLEYWTVSYWHCKIVKSPGRHVTRGMPVPEINFSSERFAWLSVCHDQETFHRRNTKNNWNNSTSVAFALFASRPSSPGYESAVCSCDFGKEQYLFAAAPCVWSAGPLKMPIVRAGRVTRTSDTSPRHCSRVDTSLQRLTAFDSL